MDYYTDSDFEALGKHHAQLYKDIQHHPTDVKDSYSSLIQALIQQWHALEHIGYSFSMGGDAYVSSLDMFNHVKSEHRLIILDTRRTSDNMPDDHPMLTPVPVTAQDVDTHSECSLTANDVFRGVHDLLGHYLPRNQFGPTGEYNAWLSHMASLPEDSWPALFCETRGQNAWTNYADDHQNMPARDRPFPEQKAGSVLMSSVFDGMHTPSFFPLP
jgi:hypothetical protein